MIDDLPAGRTDPGQSVAGLAPLQRGTAMMFQSYALFPHRGVLDNVEFSLKVRGADKASRHAQARELLAKVQLESFADGLPPRSFPADSNSAWRSPGH